DSAIAPVAGGGACSARPRQGDTRIRPPVLLGGVYDGGPLVSGFLNQLDERVKTLAGDWTKYSVIASFVLYLVGYLALRFHLTAIGVGTDLAVLDERYLFTGARFIVYLVATVPAIVLLTLPAAILVWVMQRLAPERLRTAVCAQIIGPWRLLVLGILLAVAMI